MGALFFPILMILIAMFSIQFGASIAKSLFPLIGAGATSGLRLFFASLILLVIWRPWKSPLNKRARWSILIYGISLGLMNLFFYLALERIPLGIVVALEFTGPLGVALLQSKNRFDFLWAFLAALGLYLILPFHSLSPNLDLLGILWALGAGVFWGLYIIFGQKAGQNENLGAVTSLGMLVAALVVLPFAFFLTSPQSLSVRIFPLAILVAILSSALPYSLEMIALKKIHSKTFGILMSLEPAIATLMGYWNLNESLTLTQLTALTCIVLASLGAALNIHQKDNIHEPSN